MKIFLSMPYHNIWLLLRSATNLAAATGESPAAKRSISTSEEAEPADGEPPVKRSEISLEKVVSQLG